MKRREFIALLGAAVACPHAGTAQTPPKAYRIGVLAGGAPPAENSPLGAALIRDLAQRGYETGKNLAFERRGAGGDFGRLPQLGAALPAGQVRGLVPTGYPPAPPAQPGRNGPPLAGH